MKKLLFVALAALFMYSCNKDVPNVISGVSMNFADAWDSCNIEQNHIYHMVITRLGHIDSGYSMKFRSSTDFTEYRHYRDASGGYHYVDSLEYSNTNTTCWYQQPDPVNYVSTQGYIAIRYSPRPDTVALDTFGSLSTIKPSFPFHNEFIADTFKLYMGAPTRFYMFDGTFMPAVADSSAVHVKFVY